MCAGFEFIDYCNKKNYQYHCQGALSPMSQRWAELGRERFQGIPAVIGCFMQRPTSAVVLSRCPDS